LFALIAVATLLALVDGASAQNLLVNGNFEQNDRTTYANYYVPPTDIAYIPLGDTVPGWTFSHSVDLYGALNAPQSGSQFLDLVGGGPITSTFSIQQTFATVIGGMYQLDFFYGNNEQFSVDGGSANFTASVLGAGTVWTGTFTHSGDTMTVRNWTEFTVNFVADSTSTTLLFVDNNHIPQGGTPNYTVAGATLDNVSVMAVMPEPGGWPIAGVIAAVSGSAMVSQRRRRRAA
jgi:hypothetical protein